MNYTIKSFDNIINLYESDRFKPVFYCIEKDGWYEIYCNNVLTWKITGYGDTKYVTRILDGVVVMRCTLINGRLNGCCYVHSVDGVLNYLLKYKDNNLHESQIHLSDSYCVVVNHGEFVNNARTTIKGNNNILDTHKRVLSMLKWV